MKKTLKYGAAIAILKKELREYEVCEKENFHGRANEVKGAKFIKGNDIGDRWNPYFAWTIRRDQIKAAIKLLQSGNEK